MTETTPNPATLKFLPGQAVLASGVADFISADAAITSPLAKRLFEIKGVTGVFLASDFISVSSDETRGWDVMKPSILGAIMDHYSSGMAMIDEGSAVQSSGADSETVTQIKKLIDKHVRPTVVKDGGDIAYQDFNNGVVYLSLHGSCAGCPSSTATLKMGIERLLRHYLPEVTEVRAVA